MARYANYALPLNEGVELSKLSAERRAILVGIAGLLALGLPRLSRAQTLTFAEFLATANPQARELVADVSTSGQDRYLRTIASLAAMIDNVPLPATFNPTNQGDTPEAYRIGVNPGGDPFTLLHWQLEPGARCRPHAHTYGNVISIALAGSVRVSNYEVVGDPDYGYDGDFTVQQTVDQQLMPGDVNLVSLDRNYIHGFVAGAGGARGLDITTRLKPRPDHGTPFLDIGERPLNNHPNTYQARWIYYD